MPPPPPDIVLNAGWESFLYAIPCFLLGIAALFRLDGLSAGRRRRTKIRRSCTISDDHCRTCLCDPDGRPFYTFHDSKRPS